MKNAVLALLVVISLISGCISHKNKSNTIVVIETGMGKIKMELYDKEAPITTSNFKKLVNDGFYDGLIFHRIVHGFVIQAGAFYPDGRYKASPYPPIKLEINEKLMHVDGAVGMARTSDPNSATSQFYICVGAHHELDGQYAVFGKVIEGMDVVEAINNFDPSHTTTFHGMQNWPMQDIMENVTIIRAYIEGT